MRRYLISIFLILTLSLNGCSAVGTIDKNNLNKDKNINNNSKPVTITDFAGRTVSFNKQPQKIVSLSPAVTEILYSMGYKDRISAVTEETVYPPDVNQKAKVGSYSDIDIDAVEKAAPDVVFASKYTYKTMAESLEEMKIPVVYAEAETYNGVFDSINMIGKIFGDEKRAAELGDSIKQKVTALREGESAQKPNVLFIQSIEPLYVAGSNTLINDEIWLSGGMNAAQDLNGYVEAQKENILSKRINVIILSTKLSEQGVNLDYLKSLEGYKELDAVKNGKVYSISDEGLAETPGARIDKAIEQMKSLIYK